jgi:AhpD family alkylhydroperoxidase
VHISKHFPAGYKAMLGLEKALEEGPLDHTLYELLKLRASQVNGCAYCIDMHYKNLKACGETEERLYMLPAWRESARFSDQERAALALAEEVTLIADGHLSEDTEAEARRLFDEESYAALIFAIATINAWNRIAISGHSEPGIYQPRKVAASS